MSEFDDDVLLVETWARLRDEIPMDFEIDVNVVRLILGQPLSPLSLTMTLTGLNRLEELLAVAKVALLTNLHHAKTPGETER